MNATIGKTENNGYDFVEGALEHYRKQLVSSFKTRIVCVSVAFFCIVLLDHVFGITVPGEVLTVLISWLALILFYLAVLARKTVFSDKALNDIHLSYYVPGVLLSTSLVHYLGGAEWIAFAMYFFDLMYSNMLMKKARGFFVTAWILTCYFFLLYAEYNAIIPHHRIIPINEASYDNLNYILTTNVIIVGAIFVLVTFVMGFFSKMRDQRELDLMVAKTRVDLKTRQLEELSDTLRTRVEENDFLRSKAAEYIAEKEAQISSVKSDLEQQIENLRKTQRAMRFMIDDLNELSQELKKVKDHLEEKVKQRTEELLNISSKLHRSERLAFMGKLAGSVTHELRNPMAVIRNAAYFLEAQKGKHNEEKLTEYIGIIGREIRVIDSIIEDIMGFARTDPTELDKVDLREVVDETITSLNIPDLVLVEKELEDVPRVMANSKQLVHAISNIANNAIVAMKGNGSLVFRVLRKEDRVCVEISDTGGGIPDEYRDYIFEPLYSTRPKGTGLGLSIAKMMVEGQKGTIDFTSRKGVGTTFTISMPVKRQDGPSPLKSV